MTQTRRGHVLTDDEFPEPLSIMSRRIWFVVASLYAGLLVMGVTNYVDTQLYVVDDSRRGEAMSPYLDHPNMSEQRARGLCQDMTFEAYGAQSKAASHFISGCAGKPIRYLTDIDID